MTDAISRSAVLALTNIITVKGIDFRCIFPEEVKHLPVLNVAPVVRCKDCVHAAPLEGYASRKFEIGLNCRACRGDSGYGITGLSFTVPDGYCDDGLRKAGEVK